MRNQFNEGRLSEAFHNALENSRYHREVDLYKVDFDVDAFTARAESLTRILFSGAKDFISGGSTAYAREALSHLFEETDDDTLRRHVTRAMDESVGQHIVAMQAVAEERWHDLILMSEGASVGPPLMGYLHRAAECYLYGLDEHCVIMCRSVLEAAFMNAIPKGVFREWVADEEPRDRGYTLNNLIVQAEKHGLINPGTALVAHEVRDAANKLIHADRTVTESLDRTQLRSILMKTASVVKTLADNEGNTPALGERKAE